MYDFKPVLSDFSKGIICGLPSKKYLSFIINYYDFLDSSYLEYYLYYLAITGNYKKSIIDMTPEELLKEVVHLYGLSNRLVNTDL